MSAIFVLLLRLLILICFHSFLSFDSTYSRLSPNEVLRLVEEKSFYGAVPRFIGKYWNMVFDPKNLEAIVSRAMINFDDESSADELAIVTAVLNLVKRSSSVSLLLYCLSVILLLRHLRHCCGTFFSFPRATQGAPMGSFVCTCC